jgi:hypothetical protein
MEAKETPFAKASRLARALGHLESAEDCLTASNVVLRNKVAEAISAVTVEILNVSDTIGMEAIEQQFKALEDGN